MFLEGRKKTRPDASRLSGAAKLEFRGRLKLLATNYSAAKGSWNVFMIFGMQSRRHEH